MDLEQQKQHKNVCWKCSMPWNSTPAKKQTASANEADAEDDDETQLVPRRSGRPDWLPTSRVGAQLQESPLPFITWSSTKHRCASTKQRKQRRQATIQQTPSPLQKRKHCLTISTNFKMKLNACRQSHCVGNNARNNNQAAARSHE